MPGAITATRGCMNRPPFIPAARQICWDQTILARRLFLALRCRVSDMAGGESRARGCHGGPLPLFSVPSITPPSTQKNAPPHPPPPPSSLALANPLLVADGGSLAC